MASGYDISASASSAINEALSYAFHSDIVFGNAGSSGIEQAPKPGDAQAVSARSLQGQVSTGAGAQDPEGTFTSTADDLLASAGLPLPSSGSYSLYYIIGGALLLVVLLLKRK